MLPRVWAVWTIKNRLTIRELSLKSKQLFNRTRPFQGAGFLLVHIWVIPPLAFTEKSYFYELPFSAKFTW